MIIAAQQVTEAAKAPTKREQNQQLMAAMYAAGDGVDEIAKKLDIDQATVAAFVSSKYGATMIVRLQAAYTPDPRQRVTKMAHSALDTLQVLMLTAQSETVKLGAANSIADRAMGKAVQVVESRNFNFDVNNLQDLDRSLGSLDEQITKLEQMKKMKRADAISG